ncbi:H(+)-transporting V1 sector ATPase subunit H [Malassezia sp. CBS 17886]|nr:H(+)-transporting V1 sector ATPase subunit H [Malassezia sp. CBS 17886]
MPEHAAPTGPARADDAALPQSPLLPLVDSWLERTSARLRARPTAWEGYQRADLVSSEELQMIRDAEAAGREARMDSVLSKGQVYADLYIKLLAKLSRIDTVQEVILLMDDLVQAAPTHLDWFLHVPSAPGKAPQPYATLLKLLDMDNAYVSLMGARFLVLIFGAAAAACAPVPQEVQQRLVAFFQRQLAPATQEDAGATADGADGHAALIALVILGVYLRVPHVRAATWADEVAERERAQDVTEAKGLGLIATLVALIGAQAVPGTPSGSRTPEGSAPAMHTSMRPQLQYQALFALWVLTFDTVAAANLDVYFAVDTVLVQVAQHAVKHKVVRLIVSIWRNMLTAAPEANATRLLGAKVLPMCATLKDRRYADKEMDDDLAAVAEKLSARQEQMTSYEQYASELNSARLSSDNPVHELDDFWKENGEKLVENNEAGLRQLVSLVKSSAHSDPTTLAVACADIGKFVHYVEGGRRRVNGLGAKDAIMDLVDHPDSQVRYNALQTLARLVSASWR